jgi:hypothetical protein
MSSSLNFLWVKRRLWLVSQALALPSFPPGNVWEAYVGIIIWIPLLMRLLFLSKPFWRTLSKLSPHGGWFIKRVKEMPIRGYGLLLFNETLGFTLPPLLVLTFRMLSDPLGWSTWRETPLLAGLLLVVLLGLWVFFDFLRILRIRRMLRAIEKQNINRLKKIADAGFGLRGWLRKFSGRDKTEEEQASEPSPVNKVAKGALSTWGVRILKARKLTPAGLVSSVAMSAAVEGARYGVGKVSDKIDEKLQQEFDKVAKANSSTVVVIFLRDVAMGLFPLFAIMLVAAIF